ncbi:glycosyltransferase family 2 protein [Metabacillus halosaccharovorans]|uniref:glycosyltransferase family 2 protein n=1 Tax=Bacillaceae TaxID=186817 RepID=UPI00047DDEBD|nr:MULTISPECIES: glycosyltransferase family 2 protein [Bacillaceae]MCM3440410.1 glycosyltransferase [Metabacillus halosaccharovorans]
MAELTIIIPTYNHADRLRHTLEHLALQEGIDETEVIVVNDGSIDGTAKYVDHLTYKWLTVVHQENKGRSQARNNGLKRAKSNYVLFLDSDILLCPGYLKELLAAQNKNPGIYFGDLFNIHFDKTERCVSLLRKQKTKDGAKEQLKKLEKVDLLVNMARYFKMWHPEQKVGWPCLTAANFSAPLSILKKAGPFDENFTGWGVEDHEYAFRLNETGAEIYYLDTIYGCHLDKAKEKINIPLLVENLLYFHKKSKYNSEVRAYLEFVSGHDSLQALFRRSMNMPLTDCSEEIYFRPYKHIRAKQVTANGR